MSILPVLTVPHPILRQVAAPVAEVDARIVKLMKDMVETMYKDHGIGLAANQVGVLERVITVDLSEERDGSSALMMANPTILWQSEETFSYCEGCLSVPDELIGTERRAEVTRPRAIRVGYIDEKNTPREIEAEDLFSQCLQHEIDHLNGILYIDRLSKMKRDIIKRKIDKALRLQGEV